MRIIRRQLGQSFAVRIIPCCRSITIVQSISTHEYAEQHLTRVPKKFCYTVNRTFTIFKWSHGQCFGRCFLCFFYFTYLFWKMLDIQLLSHFKKIFQLLHYCNFSPVRQLVMKEIAAIMWLTLPDEGHAPWGYATQLEREQCHLEWG